MNIVQTICIVAAIKSNQYFPRPQRQHPQKAPSKLYCTKRLSFLLHRDRQIDVHGTHKPLNSLIIGQLEELRRGQLTGDQEATCGMS
uniref:Uncharacterized protein n=1 Tax=Anguilla anguilla TaxID=7936 RepID=A0A0E9S3Y7_ANGAN